MKTTTLDRCVEELERRFTWLSLRKELVKAVYWREFEPLLVDAAKGISPDGTDFGPMARAHYEPPEQIIASGLSSHS